MDSDDIWPENKLEKQINEMLKNNYNFTYTDFYFFFGDNQSKFRRFLNRYLFRFNFKFRKLKDDDDEMSFIIYYSYALKSQLTIMFHCQLIGIKFNKAIFYLQTG